MATAATNPAQQRAAAILKAVRGIQRGTFASYGEVARRAGLPGRARLVGTVLRECGDARGLPWHRVTGAGGRIAFPPVSGEPAGDRDLQATVIPEPRRGAGARAGLALGLAGGVAAGALVGIAALQWLDRRPGRLPEGAARASASQVLAQALTTGTRPAVIEASPAPGLAESERWVVIGLGINVREGSAPAGAAALASAATLPTTPDARPGLTAPTAGQVWHWVAPALLRATASFAQVGFAPLRAAYAQRDVLAGQQVGLWTSPESGPLSGAAPSETGTSGSATSR